jgi:hypothetical protein
VHGAHRGAIEKTGFPKGKTQKFLSKKQKNLLHYRFSYNILKRLANKTASAGWSLPPRKRLAGARVATGQAAKTGGTR